MEHSIIALKQSEERYAKAFNASPLVLTISSIETGRLLEVNDAFVQMSGFTREEALGKTTQELGLWLRPNERDEGLETVQQTGLIRNKEYTFLTKNGEELIGLISAERIEVEGEPFVLTVLQNITERKRTERALRESQETLRLAMRASRMGTWMRNMATDEVSWSSELEDLFGLPPGGFAGSVNGFRDLIHLSDREKVEKEVERAIAEHTDYIVEFRFYHTDGSLRWMEGRGKAVYANTGAPLQLYGIGIDITERKRSEQHQQFLLEITEDLAQLSSVGEMMQTVGSKLGSYLNATRCVFAEYDLPRQLAIITYNWCQEGQKSMVGVYQLANLISDDTIKQLAMGKQLVVSNIKNDPRIATSSVYEPFQIGASVASPYVSDGICKYTLSVHYPSAHTWHPDELTLLKEISNRIWNRIERARAEEALKNSENQLRLITNAMPALISYVDKEHRYQFVNQAYMDWFGQPQETLRDKPVREVLGERAYQAIAPDIQKVLSGQALKFERLLPYKNGGARFVEANYIPDLQEDGVINGYYSFVQDITARKQAEAARRESEERYHALFNSIDEGFAVCEMLFDENNRASDYRFLDVNPMYEKLTGLTNVVGKTGRELVPDLEEKWFEIYGKVVLTGESIRFESHLAAWDKWYELYVSRVGKSEERKFAILFSDITERKRTEVKLQENEQDLRTLANTIPQLAWMAEPDGFVFWYNERWYDYTGTTPEQMQGWGWQSVHDPEILPQVIAGWKNSIEMGEVFEMEFPIRGADGVFRWFLTQVNPLYDSQGKIVRWFGTNTYIEDLKQAQEALVASEQHFRTLADAAPVLIWQSGLDKGCYYFNKNWLEFTGRTIEQEQENGWADGIHPEDLERCLEIYVSSFDRRESFTMEYRLRRHDGEYRWLLDQGVPTYDHNGIFTGFIGSCVDIHEKITAEEQKDAFIRIAGHELRTPLTSLLGNLNLIKRQDNSEWVDKQLQKCYASTLKMRSLINDFIYFTRSKPGELAFEISEFDFDKLLTETVENLELAHPQYHIQIEGKTNATLTGDRDRIEQVISNLVNNAVKYAPGKENIKVIAKQENNRIVLQIIDDGIGIESEEIPRLFNKFHRAPNTGKIKGMGLGLYIVKEIVDFHQGTISVESQPGKGAVFTVELPLVVN